MYLEERNVQAFSGERKGDLRRGTTREIGTIHAFVVRNVYGLGVSGGIIGPVGAVNSYS